MHNGYPTESNPKHSSFIKNIKETLEEAGHYVSLCTLNSNFRNRREHLIQYYHFYKKIWKKDFSSYDYVLMNLYQYYALPLIKSLPKIKQPVLHWHGDDLYAGKLKTIFFNMEVKKLPAHTLHITPSYYFRKELADKYNYPLSKIFVSPSGGINTDVFCPADNNKNPDIIKAGFASGLIQEKGVDLILKFLEKANEIEKTLNRQIELHYIFYGKEKAKYKNLLSKYKNVVCWNVMPTAEMYKFYQSIDVLLFPTLRRQESLGLVALEAMSCGKPVIGTDAFAVNEYIISGVSGERFLINDYRSLVESFMRVAKNIDNYSPRPIVLERYSKKSVAHFYKSFFK
jgi:glycosyltransferase involved in cell wall biosynthesis